MKKRRRCSSASARRSGRALTSLRAVAVLTGLMDKRRSLAGLSLPIIALVLGSRSVHRALIRLIRYRSVLHLLGKWSALQAKWLLATVSAKLHLLSTRIQTTRSSQVFHLLPAWKKLKCCTSSHAVMAVSVHWKSVTSRALTRSVSKILICALCHKALVVRPKTQ